MVLVLVLATTTKFLEVKGGASLPGGCARPRCARCGSSCGRLCDGNTGHVRGRVRGERVRGNDAVVWTRGASRLTERSV